METYQEHRRARLWGLLGDLPETTAPPKVASREVETTAVYRLERLKIDLNGIEEVPALFVSPVGRGGPWPCIVFNHSHGGYYDLGKRELTDGVSYRYPTPMAVELVRAGFSAISIDHWGFGDRQGAGELRIAFNMLWHGSVMWGMMVYDSIRAVDYLLTRPDVDPSRIGTTGMSMGSTMAWWLAALDTRIACCAETCCLTEFATFLEEGGFHAPFYYVPSLLKCFTTAQINALIAPRPHLSLAGDKDPLTPPRGLDIVDTELKRVYRELGAERNWDLKRYPVGHLETEQMRAETMRFLVERLQDKKT
jgi:dienelactone hydrolase